jgi:hypothetical protein
MKENKKHFIKIFQYLHARKTIKDHKKEEIRKKGEWETHKQLYVKPSLSLVDSNLIFFQKR